MMPPELLHTSASGLIMYMFESLRHLIPSKKSMPIIDEMHCKISMCIQRQSERDFFEEDQFAMVLLMVQKYSIQKEGAIYFVFYVLHTQQMVSMH